MERVIMRLLPMDKLGPHERDGGAVDFGILLPWISKANGHRLFVKLIHERDQFMQDVPAQRFELQHSIDPDYGDYWSARVTIGSSNGGATSRSATSRSATSRSATAAAGGRNGAHRTPASAWGESGRYLYRYELESPLLSAPLDWIVDPYAREYGTGQQSAFTLGYEDHAWGPIEATWKTPELRDLVVYELMLHEFAWNLDGAIERLPYLKDLGVNCVELMPVANVARSVDWGFEPIGPFGPDERFGKRRDLQRFVQVAHENGIAVVLDMIYGHTGEHFAYQYIYSRLGYHENPLMGPFAKDMFGPSVDYHRAFARDFFFTVNQYWLDRYHVDGIRYDCVPNYWDGAVGEGYSNLVYNTYKAVEATKGKGHWQRFFSGDGKVHIVQCAEQLEAPVEVVEKTYSNCTWQNETLSACNAVAHGDQARLTDLGFRLGLESYPEQAQHNGHTISKSAFQYLENHDHSRFLCNFGTQDIFMGAVLEGDRSRWFKLQPYVIGLLLAKGVPLLWEGQEIGESYHVPGSGFARIGRLRPVRWEFFYDDAGRGLISLHRNLLALRRDTDLFRRGAFFFHNHWEQWQSRGLLLFSRSDPSGYALIALNFTDTDQETQFWFPGGGTYREALEGSDNLTGVVAGAPTSLTVPSNYGRVWLSS
jgi:maltooligosyltrehalose trehalohydrolase